MIRVHAEGVDWPLETFLDAHQFTRLDGLNVTARRDRFGIDPELEVVMLSGDHASIIRMCGRHVDWHDAIAVRGCDGLAMCEVCGSPFEPECDPIYASEVANRRVYTVNAYEAETCEDCQSYSEWDW